MASFRKFSKRVFIFFNIVVVALFLLACSAKYFNPGKYWYIAMLGVGFVLLLAIVFCFFIFWLLFRSRWALLSLVAMLIGAGQIHALIGFHLFSGFEKTKEPGAIRIMHWNVTRWDEMSKSKTRPVTDRLKMLRYVKEQQADILCFEEFFESKSPDLYPSTVNYIRDSLHYPFHYFVPDFEWWGGNFQHGSAIFSRFPITDTSRMRYASLSGKEGESLLRATLNVHGQKINVFTTHLQSFAFHGNDYANLHVLKTPEENDRDKVVKAGKGIIYKFRHAYPERYLQVNMVRKQLDESKYPTVITGDFNDVPNSYTYSTIKGDYQDAFIKKAFGLGRTFHFISPTLRIDYILASGEWEVVQCIRGRIPYSDHYPVIADIRLKQGKSQ